MLLQYLDGESAMNGPKLPKHRACSLSITSGPIRGLYSQRLRVCIFKFPFERGLIFRPQTGPLKTAERNIEPPKYYLLFMASITVNETRLSRIAVYLTRTELEVD